MSSAVARSGTDRPSLTLAHLPEAFIPLKQAAVSEGLFDYTVVVAERDGEGVGFAAYTPEELA